MVGRGGGRKGREWEEGGRGLGGEGRGRDEGTWLHSGGQGRGRENRTVYMK